MLQDAAKPPEMVPQAAQEVARPPPEWSPQMVPPSTEGLASRYQQRADDPLEDSSQEESWFCSLLAQQDDEEEQTSWMSEDSEASAVHRRINRDRANRWIAETVPEVGRVVTDIAPWKLNHSRRLEEARHQAIVLKRLTEKGSLGFDAWLQKQQEEEMRTAPPIRVARAKEVPPASVFQGSLRNFCVVSYPGAHIEEWKALLETLGANNVASACVFLPESEQHKGQERTFRRHLPLRKSPGDCLCQSLYGGKKEWGCYWFKLWVANVKEALALGLTPLVVFLPDHDGDLPFIEWDDLAKEGDHLWNGTNLGGSQKGEVAWLRKQGIEFQTTTVNKLHQMLTKKEEFVMRVPDHVTEMMSEFVKEAKDGKKKSMLPDVPW